MDNHKDECPPPRLTVGQQPRHPAAQLAPIIEAQLGSQQERSIKFRKGQRTVTVKVHPPGTSHKIMTAEEKFAEKRRRFTTVLPGRLSELDRRFNFLIKVSNREYYEFTKQEVDAIEARLSAWVDAVKESFRRRQPFYPTNLAPVILADQIEMPDRTAKPPKGLEDVW
jgi:hypothetical protein